MNAHAEGSLAHGKEAMNRATIDTLAGIARELADQGRTTEAEAIRAAMNELGVTAGLITTGEAAEKLGVSIPTVRRWTDRGTLTGVGTGTRLLVALDSVERVLRIRRNLKDMDAEGNPTAEEMDELEPPGNRVA